MDDSDVKKAKIKVVDIIKKLDDKKAGIKPAVAKDLEKKKDKEETPVKSDPLVSPLSWSERHMAEEKKEEPKKKTDNLKKLFEKIDRKEREVLGKNISQQIIEKEIPHLKEDSLHIALPERMETPLTKQKKKWKIVAVWTAFFVFFALGAYGAWAYLPKSDIKIAIKKFRWDYDNPIILSSKISDIDVANREIPVAIFSQNKNTNFPYPASGNKYVERKASGIIVIYNTYSTDQQVLVSGTRFEAPDGRIFKLTKRVVVPGTKVNEGKIVASFIEADVEADKAGEPYNVGMVSRFTIPGFKGTARYDKFYAESKTAIAGGFVGEVAYPTDEDIKIAKSEAEKSLRNAIEAFIISQISSEDYRLINSSEQFKVSKETVNRDTDESGNFYVFVEAELSMTAFKKSHMLGLLTEMAKQVINTPLNLTLKTDDYSINYKDVVIDSKTKIMTLPVKFSGVFWEPIDLNSFRQKIVGKSEAELKSIIYSYPNIEKADFSFWPFWASKVPLNQNRVNINVN